MGGCATHSLFNGNNFATSAALAEVCALVGAILVAAAATSGLLSSSKYCGGDATGWDVGLATQLLWVRLPVGSRLRNDSRQVVHTHVPPSPSSIIWYRPKGGDAARLAR